MASNGSRAAGMYESGLGADSSTARCRRLRVAGFQALEIAFSSNLQGSVSFRGHRSAISVTAGLASEALSYADDDPSVALPSTTAVAALTCCTLTLAINMPSSAWAETRVVGDCVPRSHGSHLCPGLGSALPVVQGVAGGDTGLLPVPAVFGDYR